MKIDLEMIRDGVGRKGEKVAILIVFYVFREEGER